ncbi:hypothetical protein L211DRAFT_895585 [Terfezia boudieri ATCC MYA-4762]|uniref:Uncharacterized protein n=1 Tax=Terfezia boudieri ATCC MYA-4762 TaxID=1051890 RepID=A0A3N4LDX6_9PEZI|nr:hypothetical protein L211DRAFT_895585 [Terfezia boudieri ATCC MYA-4762]
MLRYVIKQVEGNMNPELDLYQTISLLPAPLPVSPLPLLPSEVQPEESVEGIEEEIYDCIRVLYLQQANTINVENSSEPEDEVVEDTLDDVEAQIIDAYQPVPNEESEPESEPPPPPRITHTAALEALETLILYKLQAGTIDSTQQQLFYRERRRIEGAQMADRGRQRQRTLEECVGVVKEDV